MSLGGGGTTIRTEETRVTKLQISTSAYGVGKARVWGKQRVSGNVLWYGDFNAIPHTTRTSSGGGGGKGGGGSVTTKNTSYTYTAGAHACPVQWDDCRSWRHLVGQGGHQSGRAPDWDCRPARCARRYVGALDGQPSGPSRQLLRHRLRVERNAGARQFGEHAEPELRGFWRAHHRRRGRCACTGRDLRHPVRCGRRSGHGRRTCRYQRLRALVPGQVADGCSGGNIADRLRAT